MVEVTTIAEFSYDQHRVLSVMIIDAKRASRIRALRDALIEVEHAGSLEKAGYAIERLLDEVRNPETKEKYK